MKLVLATIRQDVLLYLFIGLKMDTPMVYEICRRYQFGLNTELEVIDSTDNMQDAEYLCKEYNLAFGTDNGYCFIR